MMIFGIGLYRFRIISLCKTPDDGHRNCPKRVEFYSKNKFEKLLLLVGFIVRIYHDAPSSVCHIRHDFVFIWW